MDFVTHNFPEWTWGHINRCRLYLKANIFANITSNDGTFIPDQIRTVKVSIRENKISFPAQGKPSKMDKRFWEYFISSISEKGILHLPLKEWTRDPDQYFQYVWDGDNKIVYKRKRQNWQVFGKKQRNSRWYWKL